MNEEIRDKVNNAKDEFIRRNGALNSFSVKEVMLMMTTEIKEELRKCQSEIANTREQVQHMLDSLPEKGFCADVTSVLWPQPPEPALDSKVAILWHDRRWLRGIVYALLGLVSINLIIQII